MIDLSKRSYEKELMDRPGIPFTDMAQTLKELNIINTRLGGHAITISGLKKLLGNATSVSVCEIGCGGGDNLKAIEKYCRKNNITARFTGIDMNPECIRFAQQQYPTLDCQWICSDYAAVDFDAKKPDIIFTSLFCHHFTDEQLVSMLEWLQRQSVKGFFINDLHRHWLAFYLIRYITRFFSRSYLVKNDASLSVARSFTKPEWENLLTEARTGNYSIKWKWAFRWLVISTN